LNDVAGDDGREWELFHPDSLALACVELSVGRIEQAKARLDAWSDDRYESPPPTHVWLSKQLAKFSNEARRVDGTRVALPDWVTT
jgi:hypothetical protein